MINVAEARDIGGPSRLNGNTVVVPRDIAQRASATLPAQRKRLLPRLWDVVSVSSTRKIKEMSALWPVDIDAVNEWFPLDGEEGELVEDEGFLDAIEDPAVASHDTSTQADTQTPPIAPCRVDIVSCLPPEIALQILLHLDLPSIISSSSVSRYWNALAHDMQIWKDLFFAQPHWQVNPSRAARRRMNSRASRASSTFASPAALYSRWGRNSLLSLRSVTNETSYLEAPPLTLAMDWMEMFKTRLEVDRRWLTREPKFSRLAGHHDRYVHYIHCFCPIL